MAELGDDQTLSIFYFIGIFSIFFNKDRNSLGLIFNLILFSRNRTASFQSGIDA